MAYAPIALTIPQYENYPNNWLKAYEQGTTTPLSMATDAAAGTLLVKCELDAQGFPITAGSARFIPFIDGDYDLWLFPTSTDADADDTTNAIQFADNLNADPSSSRATVDSLAELRLLTSGTDNETMLVLGYATAGDGGGDEFYWDPLLTATDDDGTIVKLATVTTGRYLRLFSGAYNVKWFGAKGDDATDDQAAIYNCMLAAVGTVFFPTGIYKTLSVIYLPKRLLLKGVGFNDKDPYDSQTAIAGSVIKGYHTGVAVLSFKGITTAGIEDLGIHGDATLIPQTGLCLGRSSSASVGLSLFKNINVSGYFSKAAIYCIASEENTWINLQANLLGGGGLDTLYISKDDDLAVDSLTSGSMYVATFLGSRILNQSETANSAVIHIKGSYGLQSIAFYGGFTAITSGTAGTHVRISIDQDTDPLLTMANLVFDGIGHEAASNASPPVSLYSIEGAGSGGTLHGLVIRDSQNGQDLGGTSYYINANSAAKLVSADITNHMMLHPSVINSVTDSNISLPYSNLTIQNANVPLRNTIKAKNIILTTSNLDSTEDSTYGSLTYYEPVFAGSGLDDMTLGASHSPTSAQYRHIIVAIDGTASPNTFKWSKDGGGTWTTGVNITGSEQVLTEGIYIDFNATTGHTAADQWTIEILPPLEKLEKPLGDTVYGKGRSMEVSTTAVTIYPLPTASSIAYLIVTGFQGSHYFMDQVSVVDNVVTVISSTTITGTPEARTYSYAGTPNEVQLKVALNTYIVKTAPLEFLFS